MRDLLFLAAQALYLFSPLLVAAALSAAVHRLDLLPRLRRPIDGGSMLGGRRIFGDGKTWRGVAIAIAGCIPAAAAQKYLIGASAGSLAVIDYARVDVLLFGAVLGAAAIAGELPNSFVKRRLGIAPGQSAHGLWGVLFYVWDQVDLLTTAWPAIASWVRPTAALVTASFVVALVIHPVVALVGYLLGARSSPR